jgi:hypothetical protein
VRPEIVGRNKMESVKLLPMNSVIKFVTETKDLKRYLILKTTKWVENYLENRLNITMLPFDHRDRITLKDYPHEGREVSLFVTEEYNKEQDRFRFIGKDGRLKIMGRALVYNYTPIPLQVCGYYLLPD